jgi:ABC-type multidrug transport system ATPase subunit
VSSAAERRQFVDALLRQANPWDVCKKALFTFSGGMKQRFGIAQALLGNPRLLIVDEPTAGLDPAERNRFLNLLSSLSSDRTVILSTHIVDDVRQLCPRMAIIAAGELLLEGSPNDTLAALNGKIWSKVVAGDDELRSLETQLPVISTHLVGGHEIRVYADTSRATVSAPSIPGWRSSISSIFQGRPRANFRTNASKLEDPTWHCFGADPQDFHRLSPGCCAVHDLRDRHHGSFSPLARSSVSGREYSTRLVSS